MFIFLNLKDVVLIFVLKLYWKYWHQYVKTKWYSTQKMDMTSGLFPNDGQYFLCEMDLRLYVNS